MVHLSWEQVQERILAAEDVSSLRAIREQAHEAYRDPLLFADFLDFHRGLNRMHDALIRRAVALAAAQTAKRSAQLGLPVPELPHAFVLFGSGGRSEMTLGSDQDNGLVYDDPGNGEEAAHAACYFEQLANRIHDWLLELGYAPCTGGVLAGNSMWRKSYTDFVRMVKGWMEEPVWENVRYLLIFSDMRCIYGDNTLADRLRCAHLDYAKAQPPVLRAMLRNTLHHKVAMGVFGQLITERYGEDAGGVDIKYGVYIPIVNGIRLLAVQAGIAASSTLERIDGLERAGAITAQLADEWREITKIALKLRAMTPLQQEGRLYTTRGKLQPEALTKEIRRELKRCLGVGRKLQSYVRHAIKDEDT
jgi:CBS domain-containing protein